MTTLLLEESNVVVTSSVPADSNTVGDQKLIDVPLTVPTITVPY